MRHTARGCHRPMRNDDNGSERRQLEKPTRFARHRQDAGSDFVFGHWAGKKCGSCNCCHESTLIIGQLIAAPRIHPYSSGFPAKCGLAVLTVNASAIDVVGANAAGWTSAMSRTNQKVFIAKKAAVAAADIAMGTARTRRREATASARRQDTPPAPQPVSSQSAAASGHAEGAVQGDIEQNVGTRRVASQCLVLLTPRPNHLPAQLKTGSLRSRHGIVAGHPIPRTAFRCSSRDRDQAWGCSRAWPLAVGCLVLNVVRASALRRCPRLVSTIDACSDSTAFASAG
jgi:hypothetical protein